MNENEEIITIIYLSISESNYKHINKKAVELRMTINALINLILSNYFKRDRTMNERKIDDDWER